MQALILAAGMGKRLGDLTQNNTKSMVKVNGITLIERMLEQITRFGIDKITLVIGYKGKELKEFIAKLPREYPVEYIENPIYHSTNNIYSLYLAREVLLRDDTLLFESDLIFEDDVLSGILQHPYPNLALVAKFESWMDGTVVTIDEKNNITQFITKDSFAFEDIPHYFKTVNIYKFSKEFSTNRYLPFLEAYSKALGNNEYYEQVLKVISLLDRPDIKALDIKNANWYEIDDIQDLEIAESIFVEDDAARLEKIQSRYGGYWRYPYLKDFCYLVNPYFPNSKLLAEIKANFGRLIGEYPSGARVNNLLGAKYFGIKPEYVCVGNGAAELIKSLTSFMNENVGIIFPTFEEYPNRWAKEQIVEYIPNNADFRYTADDLIRFYADKDISYLLLVNPDNPSGNFIAYPELLSLLEWTKERNIKLILDESFVDFSEGFESNSLLRNDILARYPNLIVMKSISKSYGVPGLRLGVMASGDLAIIDAVKKDVAIWNINSFAEFYLQIYGKYEEDYRAACRVFSEERARFYHKLSEIPFLRVIPSQANYFLCEIVNGKTAKQLAIALLKHNILIKDCSSKRGFDGKQYIRIAIRDGADNDFLIEKLYTL